MLKIMTTRNHLGGAAILALACSLSCAAQDRGNWMAASNSANSITGDIAISETKVSINFTGFLIAEIRKLGPAEVSAVFDADVNAGGNGLLYRLNVPASKRFVHHNSLCGTEDTQWMATYVEDRTLRVAFFSGSKMPVFTFEALSNSTDLCGTYTYVR
jgi:hypothetical protein